MKVRGALAGAAACLVLLLAPSLSAQLAKPRVVLVHPSDVAERWEAAERRVMGELRASGFEVISASESTELTLAQIVQNQHGRAAVRVAKNSQTANAEIFMFDARTTETASTQLQASAKERARAPALFALRIVEVLHASMMDIDPARPNINPSIPPRPPVAKPKPHSDGCAVRLGALAANTGSELGTFVGPLLGGACPSGKWLIEAELFTALDSAEVKAPAGSAKIGLARSKLALGLVAWNARTFQLGGAIGSGALLAWATAKPEPGFVARSDLTWLPMVSLELFARMALFGSLGVRAGLGVEQTLPTLEIVFANQAAAKARLPIAQLSLALERTWSE